MLLDDEKCFPIFRSEKMRIINLIKPSPKNIMEKHDYREYFFCLTSGKGPLRSLFLLLLKSVWNFGYGRDGTFQNLPGISTEFLPSSQKHRYDSYADWDATRDYFNVMARNRVSACRLQAGGSNHGITLDQIRPALVFLSLHLCFYLSISASIYIYIYIYIFILSSSFSL